MLVFLLKKVIDTLSALCALCVHREGQQLTTTMTNIEKYCTSVLNTGNEIRIRTEEPPTECLYDRMLAVSDRFGVECLVDQTGFVIKPKTR